MDQDAKYAFAECGHEVYEGENMYWVDGRTFCPECFEDYVLAMLNRPAELAEMMGGEVIPC